MTSLNRRTFMAAAAGVPFSGWLARSLAAQPANRYVRPEARSPQGQAMLRIYADAVGKMMQDPNSPRSWLFQWYTHWVKGRQSPYQAALQDKNDAIAAAYPGDDPNPSRDLAREMWSNCEAHGLGVIPQGAAGFPPQVEDYFLPWHRLYLLYFEQIIRAVSGKDEFALPYWNYSTDDPNARGVIPPEFTRSNDPVFSPLYVENRNDGVNQGVSIEQIALDMGIPNALALDALQQQDYGFISDAVQGFNQTLDFGLHGNVHVAVGTNANMGNIPTAAGDPIFWLHHCNIDRLWTSWSAAGNTNPPMDQTFVFADGQGNRVVANLKDVLDPAALNYGYDRLEDAAAPNLRPHLTAAFVRQRGQKVRAATGRIALASTAVKAPLAARAAANAAPKALSAHAEALDVNGRMYLVVRDLVTDRQPGTLYALYLDLPASPTMEQKKAHAVGVINFFHAHPDPGVPAGGHAGMAASHSVAASFDVTSLVQSLRKAGTLSENPELTIVPVRPPSAAAKPVVGDVSVVEI
jgi:tyrosinase